MPKQTQASPVFSVLLCALCVKSLLSLRKKKLLTQRAQRSTEKTEVARDASAVDRNEIQMLPVMNSLEQKILAAFDEPGARARSLADLGDPATVQGVVSQLVE